MNNNYSAFQFTEKLSEESAKNFFQLIYSSLKKFGKITIDEVKIRTATENYAASYLRRFGSVKILGMVEPIPLQQLYTEVEIVYPHYRLKEQIIGDLENNFRVMRGDFGTGNNRIDGLKIANENQKLNVLGAPGSGKSTFLRRIGLECLTIYPEGSYESYKHKCIPVLIELKRFKNETVNLERLIQYEFEIAGFPESNRFIKRILKEGKLLILLDGLDEVPESKLSELLEHLKDFTDKYHENRFITSCRTAFYKNYLNGFVDVEISSFTNQQIERFAVNWFSRDNDILANTSSLFITQLFKEGNEASVELARTPLLLAYLCMTFDQSQRFPSNRASLYKQALSILMQKWAAEKRIHNEDIYQDLNLELETEMLANIAANFYKSDKIFFFQADLKKEIRAFLESRITARQLDILKVLHAIEVQQGILVERSPDIYSFSHLTIQEYLTAHYYNTPKRIHELINNHMLESRWREVFLLLTGIGDPNDTLLLMLNFLEEYSMKNPIISETINWISKIFQPTNRLEQDASKKVFLASLLIRYKRYDSGFPNQPERLEIYADKLLEAISSVFYDFSFYNIRSNINKMEAVRIIREVANWTTIKIDTDVCTTSIMNIRPKIPISKMVMGSRHAYRKEIVNELYSALQIPETIRSQRRKVYSPLLKYFDAFTLLIDCTKSSSLVSKDVRDKIYKKLMSN